MDFFRLHHIDPTQPGKTVKFFPSTTQESDSTAAAFS